MSHARLSPSNKRWPHCPGSVREEAKYPDITNDAAIEGTGVHLLIEMCLLQGKLPKDFEGETIGEGNKDKPRGWKVTPGRIDAAEYMFAYIDRFPDAEVEAESKSNPGAKFGRDDWYGTADVTIKTQDYLDVCDYKNGRGWVDADSTQTISYAYGKWTGQSHVRLSVVQPKTKPPIRYVDITGDELERRAVELNEAAKLTDDPNAPLVKGGHCQWCKHKQNCTEFNKVAETIVVNSSIQEHFTKLIEDVSKMTQLELADILDAEPVLMALFDKAKEEAQLRLEGGKKFNGWAMKPGRTNRKWSNEKELEKYLRENKVKVSEFMESKLKSPTQMEKIKGIDISDFIVESSTMKLSKVKRVTF
jgi:hypothetical protein